MGFFGGFEVLIIIILIVFLFGAKKIPELARGIGQGIKEFKNAKKNENGDQQVSNGDQNQKDGA
jgi:sec-independent protein translocase protein TatA